MEVGGTDRVEGTEGTRRAGEVEDGKDRKIRDKIIDLIKKHGPISFKRFMEICLTGKDLSLLSEVGYSTRFMDCFSKAFVAAAKEMLELCEGNSIYDFGVSDQSFVKRVALLMPEVEYFLVNHRYLSFNWESIPENVHVIKEMEISEVNGIMISNKLLSMLPFHIVLKDEKEKEVYVGYENGLVEIPLDLKDEELKTYIERVEEPRSRIEVCLEAMRFVKSLGEKLSKGFVVTSDYLSDPAELGDAEKAFGTITCYDDTTHTHNPFLMPGKLIIRASINISGLVEYGEDSGLRVAGLTNHLHLMRSTIGIVDEFSAELEKISGSRYRDSKLGTVKILIQQKGIRNPILKCLKFVPQFGFWEKYNYPNKEDVEILPEG